MEDSCLTTNKEDCHKTQQAFENTRDLKFPKCSQMTGVFYDSIMHGKRFLYLLYNIATRTFQTEQHMAHHQQNRQHMFTKQEIKARLQNFSSQDDEDKRKC